MNRFKFNTRLIIFLAILIFGKATIFAHQQPTTIVLLDIIPDKVSMELQIPLTELELAFGNNVTQNTETLVERLSPQLKDYLKSHIRPMTGNQAWTVDVTEIKVAKAEQIQSGKYQEIIAHLNLTPPENVGTRQFTLNYDVIMHQVVTHSALVSIRSDWETGIASEQPVAAGVIAIDTGTAQVFPLEINLEKGDLRQGFVGMIKLGIRHIKEGTDHLLFLLVLLFPAMLLVQSKKPIAKHVGFTAEAVTLNRWGEFGGSKYSISRLLKIVTAFTVGHSITLLIGALGWLKLPQQPVEILIAVSILVSAIHAIRPIFAGKETYVATGFGLVHGLAFATVLSDLNLNAGQMALSILGFNIGIELMQIFVITLIMPWLILLALTPAYKFVRIIGASFAAIAAVAWIVERVSGDANLVSSFIEKITEYAPLGILILAVIAFFVYGWQSFKKKSFSVTAQKF